MDGAVPFAEALNRYFQHPYTPDRAGATISC